MSYRGKSRTAALLLVLVSTVALSSCWIPENFEAKVTINKDGSYTFTYDGTLTFALALAAAKKGGLSPRDEAEFQKAATELRKDRGFKKADYLGKGRYKVLVETSGKPGEPYYFIAKELRLFAVLPQNDRTILVTGIRPKPKELSELNAIGARIEGTLSVSAANGVKVLKHNAESTPTLLGLLGAYTWKIKSPAAEPMILLQPAP